MTKAGCKTRKKFIKMLRNALLWRYNSNEIQDIISDYDGFFAPDSSRAKPKQNCAANSEILKTLQRALTSN